MVIVQGVAIFAPVKKIYISIFQKKKWCNNRGNNSNKNISNNIIIIEITVDKQNQHFLSSSQCQ